ncbi:MAG: hypothetical protein H6660_01840 [Ardenticatenaceae bacterium]|nr:hypothetical protein [Ardenticatenaceae bacterium]
MKWDIPGRLLLWNFPRPIYLLLLLFLFGTGCKTDIPKTPLPPTPTSVVPATPVPTALMGNEPVQPLFNSPAYGIHTFLWWKPDIAQRDLGLVRDMGFGWVKQKFPWREIEGIEKGAFDWYRTDLIVQMVEQSGLQMVVRLDQNPLWAVASLPSDRIGENQPPANYQDFGDYCYAVAERYHGRIAAYQVWNEPNLSREWGNQPPDPAAYTELLRVCYEGIKTADPGAIVISAGLAPTGTPLPVAMPDTEFLQGMYAAGAGAYFDVLGIHAPGYKAPPEMSPDEVATSSEFGNGRWFAFRHVEDMRAIMVANGDGYKQVAILEMGWTLDQVNEGYTWYAVDEATQADYLVRAYRFAKENWQPWIGLMTTVYIADYEWTQADEQWWWSVVLPDGTPRPAYYALRDMEK